jgi:serine/threonine-protein kinase
MAHSFTISTTTTTVLIDQGRGEAVFTVTNVNTQVVRGRAKVVPLEAAKDAWFAVEGEAERDLQPNETQSYRVRVAPSADSPAGKYSFRLDMVSVVNPDEDYTEGPVVSFDYKPAVGRRPFPWWVIPVAAVVLLAVGLVVWHFLAPSDKAVPSVTGLAYADAEAKLTGAGFKVEKKPGVEGKDPGTVLDQDPAANTVRPTGSVVTLTVEADLVAVPDLDHMKLPDAQQKVQELGLLLAERRYDLTSDPAKDNTIENQDPPGGQGPSEMRVHPGFTIVVDVFNEGVAVPKLKGHSWDTDAPKLLSDAGLKPGMITSTPPPPGDPGDVVQSTNPPENTTVASGSAVDIVLSEKKIFVPELVGHSLSDAETLVKSAGLNVGTVTKQPNFYWFRPGNVLSQNPAPGAPAKSGDSVAMVVQGLPWKKLGPSPIYKGVMDPNVIKAIKGGQP